MNRAELEAAAPELYDALLRLLNVGDDIHAWFEARDVAVIAIKKANGGKLPEDW